MSRYSQLLAVIDHVKPKCIIEVGTWNGFRAIAMATAALKHGPVSYIGFDLFEDGTPEDDARELNVKAHINVNDVRKRLTDFANANPGFSFDLHKGDTRKTLPGFKMANPEVTFVFLDGGHSVETIKSDYEALKDAKWIAFDDFYDKDERGLGPDITKFGCNSLIENLNDVMVLPEKNTVRDGGLVSIALKPFTAWPGKVNLVIKTKNCVPDEEIKSNISYAVSKIGKWIPICSPHNEIAVFCSGGPKLGDDLEDIREWDERGAKIFCVKHSHDLLIENNIIPFGCMLLDPRSHVQDFIENPHPNILYFTASMCHPTTLDRLIEREANIWGYHALVGASEDKVIPKLRPDGTPHFMIGGGSTSAVRGISVLHTIGFRKFFLYGYDSCYWGPVDMNEKTKTGAQKYFNVEVMGRKFITDAELLAQAQDFEKLLKVPQEIEMNVKGDGIIKHIWESTRQTKPAFQDVFRRGD